MGRIETTLFKGSADSANKKLSVSYIYDFNQDGNFPSIKQNDKRIVVHHSFALCISEGYEKPRIFIPGVKYFHFISLLDKIVTLVSDKLYEIFPNMNGTDVEPDSRVLERYQTEKALAVAGMTAMPSVWVDEFNSTYPAIRITSKNGYVAIPLEDAIPIAELLKRFDPITYGIETLKFFGKWEE